MTAPRFSEKPAFTRRMYYCAHVGCELKCSRLSGADMFCLEHWRLVPDDVQKLVLHAWREGMEREAKWSANMENAMTWARDEILSVVLNGHRVPKPQDFQW